VASYTQALKPSLDYVVEWRPFLWLRPLEYALRDPGRFAGKRILDLGCRYGKVSCWFAAQGATVTGVDINPKVIEIAVKERAKWNIGEDRLTFATFDGNLTTLPREQYDIVFTKGVLVILNPLGDALEDISNLLKPGGEYLAVENAAAGFPISTVRRYLWRNWNNRVFHGIDQAAMAQVQRVFPTVSSKKFLGMVYTIQAYKAKSPA